MEQVIPKSLAHAEQSDPENNVRDLGRWARIATMSCTSIVAIGTSLALPWVLWFAAGVAFATVIFRNHPAEVLYNRVVYPVVTKMPTMSMTLTWEVQF